MAILPVNLHACAFGLEYTHLSRSKRRFGQCSGATVFAFLVFLFFFGEKANSLVAHTSILEEPGKVHDYPLFLASNRIFNTRIAKASARVTAFAAMMGAEPIPRP